MRRSSTPLTAWPAFADLMTVLAVVSLAIAVGLGGDPPPNGSGPRDPVTGHLDDGFVIPNDEIVKPPPGSPSCLSNPDPPPTTAPLLRIVAPPNYVVTGAWLSEHEEEVDAIPQLDDFIEQGRMGMAVEEFERYANAIHRHGDRTDTLGGSCRFFVVLEKGETESAFAPVLGVVNQYFLIQNPAEVNRILRNER